MVVESWITPEETPALAAEAAAMIDARLARFGEEDRATFWSSIAKCYNAPYNPPARVRIEQPALVAAPIQVARSEVALTEVELPDVDLPVAAIAAAALAADLHAG